MTPLTPGHGIRYSRRGRVHRIAEVNAPDAFHPGCVVQWCRSLCRRNHIARLDGGGPARETVTCRDCLRREGEETP